MLFFIPFEPLHYYNCRRVLISFGPHGRNRVNSNIGTYIVNMKTDPITDLIANGMISPTFDLTIDYADIALHHFCDNEILNNLPVIKSIVAAVKIRNSVSEIFFIKKLLTFLKNLHTSRLDVSEIDAFKSRFDTNNEYKNQVIEQVMIMNERFISVEKSKIYAKIFKAHIYGKLSWDNLIALSAILDTFNLRAIPHLITLCKAPGYKMQSWLSSDSKLLLTASGLAGEFRHQYIASHFGLLFYHFGILEDFSRSDDQLKAVAPIYAQYPQYIGKNI